MRLAKANTLSLGGDGASTTPPVELQAAGQPASSLQHHLEGLEHRVARQQRQLEQAVAYLQEAAFLARYHQPSLERHIRGFLEALTR